MYPSSGAQFPWDILDKSPQPDSLSSNPDRPVAQASDSTPGASVSLPLREEFLTHRVVVKIQMSYFLLSA